MSASSNLTIISDIDNNIADLDRVIATLTADRDRLASAKSILDVAPVAKTTPTVTKRGRKATKTPLILKLYSEGKSAKEIAASVDSAPTYVYRVLRQAAVAA